MTDQGIRSAAIPTRLTGHWAQFERSAFMFFLFGTAFHLALRSRRTVEPLYVDIAIAAAAVGLAFGFAVVLRLRSKDHAFHGFLGGATYALVPLSFVCLRIMQIEWPTGGLALVPLSVLFTASIVLRSEVLMVLAMLAALPASINVPFALARPDVMDEWILPLVVFVIGAIAISWRRQWYGAFIVARYPAALLYLSGVPFGAAAIISEGESVAATAAAAGLGLFGLLTYLNQGNRFIRALHVWALIVGCLPLLLSATGAGVGEVKALPAMPEAALAASIIIAASPGLHWWRDKPFLLAPMIGLASAGLADTFAIRALILEGAAAIIILWGISRGIRSDHGAMIYWGMAGMFWWAVFFAIAVDYWPEAQLAGYVTIAIGTSATIAMVWVFWWAWPPKLWARR